MEQETLYIKKLSENATTPVRGSPYSAGYDLFSAADIVIPAHQKALVPTDLSVAIPHNCYGRIAPRSGLALKKFIDVGAGVVDCDYRGPLGIVLFNFADTDFEVKKGDRVAQLILERICMAPIVEVDSLDDTERGAGGFGSTGVKRVHNNQ
ncbi:deoxyuridine 5 -triphosphate nucleotidohydrolase [Blastocystis sp. subtype 4]|uniref:deoxyuridine 5 -triphosphate nucleotidohydrolase n=1 Tax=Blastocystis sp. subtype 4 TaxID=944170 RepID=UPI000711A950|nr:deoxyuridine 5 -triphosphate nucleotidohydrolase [Blastocystis sp. subtype 4]KNB45339.1 deoxyuridine 5 -triphosphate nucleotidohydrolase [Blastocystis sp. subtype 4]|eukprot:XP_014528782.1 deoxyuridine 5 -triphosphate nucleotidohydrolase [Blastocystis sp. subtype 4]